MHKIHVYLLRISEPALWTLALLPLFSIISALLFENLLPASICLLITFLAGSTIVCLGKKRLIVALLGTFLLFISSLPFFTKRLPALFLPLLGSIVLMYTANAKSMDKEHANPFIRTMLGILFYLVAQYFSSRSDLPSFACYHVLQVPVIVGFLLFFFIELLIMNEKTIQDEAVGDSIPSSVVRHNVFLVICVFAFTTFVACIPAIGHAVQSVWEMMKRAIKVIIRFLLSLLPEAEKTGAGGGGGGLSGLEKMEAAEPSLLAIWLERIVAVLAGLLLLFLLVQALRIIYGKMKLLLQRLKAFLSQYMKNTSQDYIDEITDTRNTPEKKLSALFHRKKKRAYRKEMSNSEKIRFTYGVMVDHHPEWKSSSTAREQLDSSYASIYEKVRYAELEASDHDQDVFSELLHKKKPSAGQTTHQGSMN